MTCRSAQNVIDFRGPNIVAWPGERVRRCHAALLRAARSHDTSESEDDWTEVCHWRDEYIIACREEGIEP